MKPSMPERIVHSSGVLSSGAFGISQDNQAHILTILRDTLYSNKVLAVLREYGANAWDAHREVGKGDLPIKVVLPTELEASLVIRDFGPGLSEQDVYQVYTQYGASSKRTSNVAVGMLGIGSKSAFAYNDSFTITSFNGGLKKVYHAVLDESNIGVVMKVHEAALGRYLNAFARKMFHEVEHPTLNLEPDTYYDLRENLREYEIQDFEHWAQVMCADAETGVEIKVPVNPDDIQAFQKEASKLYSHFKPLPNINFPISAPKATWEAKNGYLRRVSHHRPSSSEDSLIAVMGCVPYRLNLDQISIDLEKAGLSNAFAYLQGGVYFDIGEIDISANREELEYKPRTKAALIEKLSSLLEEVSSKVDEIVREPSTNDWSKRMLLLNFTHETGIPLTSKYDTWRSLGSVPLYSELPKNLELEDDAKEEFFPRTFSLRSTKKTFSIRRKSTLTLVENPKIPLTTGARILIRDTTRPLRSYSLTDVDRFAVLREGFSVEEAEKELRELVKIARLEGIAVERMSTLPFRSTSAQSVGSNPKHSQSCFLLSNTRSSRSSNASSNWATADRDPDPEDVFIIINRFQPVSWLGNFLESVIADKRVLKVLFNEELPPIYGIKTTVKKPVKDEDVVGIPYKTWRLNTFKDALSMHPEIRNALQARACSKIDIGIHNWRQKSTEEDLLEALRPSLDGRHRLIRFLTERIRSRDLYAEFCAKHPGKKDALMELGHTLPGDEEPVKALNKIFEVYPLLDPANGNENSLAAFIKPVAGSHWLQYINLIDKRT